MTTNNTNNSIFKSKEHYLAFRAVWAKAVNSKDTKITATHHMLYNILRGKAFDRGFTPVTRANKLRNGFTFNYAVVRAANDIQRIIKSNEEYYLKIFEGTVTPEMVKELGAPEAKSMTPDFGPYGAVADYIISHDVKPKNFEDIQKIFDEVTHKEAA